MPPHASITACAVDASAVCFMLFFTAVDTKDGDFNISGGTKAAVPDLTLLL